MCVFFYNTYFARLHLKFVVGKIKVGKRMIVLEEFRQRVNRRMVNLVILQIEHFKKLLSSSWQCTENGIHFMQSLDRQTKKTLNTYALVVQNAVFWERDIPVMRQIQMREVSINMPKVVVEVIVYKIHDR